MVFQLLAVTGLTKYFGAKLILDNVSLALNRGEHIGLVGENGIGKTTLARLILSQLIPEQGKITFTPGIEIGYLPQEAAFKVDTSIQEYLAQSLKQLDRMQTQLTLLEEQMGQPNLVPETLSALLESYGNIQAEFARLGGYETSYRFEQVLAGLGLAYLDQSRSLHTLSGGEKTRVMLAALLLSSPDLLILDEPTNHLDFSALNWLESYLLSYQGAILVISHDRRFLNNVIAQIWELTAADHRVAVYHGNYDFYLAERERQRARQMAAYEAHQTEIK